MKATISGRLAGGLFVVVLAGLLLAACAGRGPRGGAADGAPAASATSATSATSSGAPVEAAWVQLGPDGRAVVRAITAAADCPRIDVDGDIRPMAVRAPPGRAALRPTASRPAESKPSVFAVTACEHPLPAGARRVRVAGHAQPLPLPVAQPRRIAVLADTGCRIKRSDNVFQPCNDPAAWPFATIAATIASMKPDLVIHLGDYHYRENACPQDIAGCRDSPWGYGWDTWEADFFRPAAPLLAAAPWVMGRGNHEECARGGQGWMRFLERRAWRPALSCDDPADDGTANFGDPYAVPLGEDTQIVMFDSARVGPFAFGPSDARFAIYQGQFRQVAAFVADSSKTSLFASHHPVLAFMPIAGGPPLPGNQGLQAVMRTLNPVAYYPEGVKIALHGHVHDFQALSFATAHPATFVTGNGGDNVDVNLPDPLPAGATPAPGVVIERITHTNTFGFMMMERTDGAADGDRGWLYKAYTQHGGLLTTCVPAGSKIACDRTGFLAP